ncbi:MAG: M28 family peptidase [Candidatus Thorarchaeota archaeon]|nr:M28 family peptidase [Candidatus Thorarchaeota archaeon]
MERRKLAAAIMTLAIVSMAVVGTYLLLSPPAGPEVPEQPFEIVPHPNNALNWWDIAFDMGKESDFTMHLSKITATGNRYGPSEGYYAAGDCLIDRLESLSIPASYWGLHDSVVGYQSGYGTDNRSIVFGAHLDTSRTSARGVEQNGGGCAVVMAIASILSQFRLPIDVYYCFFQGNMEYIEIERLFALWGSKEVTEILEDEQVEVIAFYNFDEILFYDPLQSERERLIIEHDLVFDKTYQETTYLADLLEAFMKRSRLDIITINEDPQIQNDHWPFWEHGFPAVNVKSGHIQDPEHPPPDRISSPAYNLTQARYLAQAAASVAVYLGNKGNSEQTTQKLQPKLGAFDSATLRAVMTVPQTLTVHGTTPDYGNITVRVRLGATDLLPTTVITEENFTIECDLPAPVGPLEVIVTNLENTTAEVELYIDYSSDSDGNGVIDSEQYSWPEPVPQFDWDGDDLSDEDEVEAGTDIFVPDTDNDGMRDGLEVQFGLDPLRDDAEDDADSDGLGNFEEIGLGTNHLNNDTDSDGIPDGWEVEFMTDPLTNDSASDPDGDTLTNLEEYQNGSDPLSEDGDSDGILDVEEIALGMDPLNEDSDGDGLRDQLELFEGLDPLSPDYDVDLIPDGPDHNPRVNSIIVMGLIVAIPFLLGSFFFWRRIR